MAKNKGTRPKDVSSGGKGCFAGCVFVLEGGPEDTGCVMTSETQHDFVESTTDEEKKFVPLAFTCSAVRRLRLIYTPLCCCASKDLNHEDFRRSCPRCRR